MGQWGIQPSEFANMTPKTWWLIYDGRPEVMQANMRMTRADLADLKRRCGE